MIQRREASRLDTNHRSAGPDGFDDHRDQSAKGDDGQTCRQQSEVSGPRKKCEEGRDEGDKEDDPCPLSGPCRLLYPQVRGLTAWQFHGKRVSTPASCRDDQKAYPAEGPRQVFHHYAEVNGPTAK